MSRDIDIDDSAIAIIGMDGRFPGAPDLDAYWSLLEEGREGVAFFDPNELEAVPAGMRADDPRLIRAQGVIDGVEDFDAQFFNIPAREARWLDPQQRLFLETCWNALENAGYDPERYEDAISVYAGVNANTYLLSRLHNFDRSDGADLFQVMLSSEKDFLSTRVAYKLNLRGESVGIQTSCSTSLVAVHMACQSLLGGQSAIALAGGVSIRLPQRVGYVFQEGMIASPDGRCRPFDAAARGTVPGSGVGVVVLKLLVDALRDGDHVHAVILGSSINNDGRAKAGFTAPSASGQSQVIARAMAMAGVDPDSIGMIEAHGTGTQLGDPIEVEALTRVFRRHTQRRGFCALGSVKSNIGHLDCAAGVAGLIKAVLALRERKIPGTVHFKAPNPALKLEESPFYVPASARPWRNEDSAPLRCGVSSFGVGGTNAHVVLEEAPARPAGDDRPVPRLFPLSACTPTALQAMAARLADHLARRPDQSLGDVAATLALGRREFTVRTTLVADDRETLIAGLRGVASAPIAATGSDRRVFTVPGLDAVRPGIASALHRRFPAYREAFDSGAALLRSHGGLDPAALLSPTPGDEAHLRRSEHALPALLLCAHASIRLWQALDIAPDPVAGDGGGEFVAACLAGVFTFEDSLRLAAACGRALAMENAGQALHDLFAATGRHAPTTPIHSPVGAALDAREATDPAHLARRCLSAADPAPAERHGGDIARIALLGAETDRDPVSAVLTEFGALWTQGRRVRWTALFAEGEVRRVPLPTYPFQRQRFWIELSPPQAQTPDDTGNASDEQAPARDELPTSAPHHALRRDEIATAFAPPHDEIEREVIAAWESVLGLEGIGRDDDFFALGGDSLLGTQVYSRLSEMFPGRAELIDVLSSGSVAALAARIRETDAGDGAKGAQDDAITVAERDVELPLSFGQEWLWSIDHAFPGNPAYNLPFAARVRGALDRDILQRTLTAIAGRHEVLRSCYPDRDGLPMQRILPPAPMPLSFLDLSGEPGDDLDSRLPSLVEVEARRAFDLRNGPLIRALLVRLGEDDHLIVVTQHHIVSDAWSMVIFGREFAAFYAAFRDGHQVDLPRLPVQYTDYAVWQRRRLGGDGAARQLDYWKRQLAGAPQLIDLPVDRPRPPRPSGRGARVSFAFDPTLSDTLRTVAQAHSATLFMVLLGGLSTLIHRLTGQDDLLIGVPLAGRTRAETENLIGCFINTVAIRTTQTDNPRFGALIEQVRDTTLAAYAHQDAPFERVVNACQVQRDPSHSPLVQVLFDFQNLPPRQQLSIDGLQIAPIGAELATAKLDLVVDMWEREGRISGSVEFNTDLFDAASIERLMRRYERLLQDAAQRPDARLAALSLDDPRDAEATRRGLAATDMRRSLAHVVPKAIPIKETPK